MLACLEEQVNRANETKQSNIAHQKQIEQKVNRHLFRKGVPPFMNIFGNEFRSFSNHTKPLISIY